MKQATLFHQQHQFAEMFLHLDSVLPIPSSVMENVSRGSRVVPSECLRLSRLSPDLNQRSQVSLQFLRLADIEGPSLSILNIAK